jgi:hypothetical protein
MRLVNWSRLKRPVQRRVVRPDTTEKLPQGSGFGISLDALSGPGHTFATRDCCFGCTSRIRWAGGDGR